MSSLNLYTTAASIRAMKHEGMAVANAKQGLHYLMSGGLYLNQSCKHLQEGRQYAWAGTIEQARNARRDYPAAAGCRTVDIRSIVPTPLQTEA